MKKIYVILKNTTIFSVLTFLVFTSNKAISQVCGPVAQDFDNTSGSTAGFTGDFMLGTGSMAGQLRKSNVVASGIYTLTTPSYELPASADFIGYGFTLSGTERVARVEIATMYMSTLTNEMITVFTTQFVPNYTAGAPTATVCSVVSLSSLAGFPLGGKYRFRIELTPNTGSGGGNQTIVFDNYRTNGTLSQLPLPVNFIGFDAKKLNSAVQLTWKVAGEENVASYKIERSEDGRRFTTIGSVDVHGKDTYHYTDAVSSSTIFYRIKNIDNDGKIRYSTIVRLANGKSSIVLKAFPQPVQNSLALHHPVISGRALINLSTADGRIVRSLVPAVGSMQTPVDMSTLQKGVYLLRFDAGDGDAHTLKVIKQ
jgi:hypothetical protein